MPADTPQTTSDEFFVVLFVVFRAPPNGFLVVCDNFEEEGGGEETEGSIVAETKGGVGGCREGVAEVYWEADKGDPGRCGGEKLSWKRGGCMCGYTDLV